MRTSSVRKAAKLALVAVLALGAAGYAFGVLAGSDQLHVTAFFSRATGIYVGDDVRILGVRVGEIDSIHPEGSRVRITFSYAATDRVPADAKAAIVSDSIVASRFIQLAPVYTGGPVLADSATIPMSRTAVPIEWDQTKKQLTRLATALGPNGVDRTGSLGRLITTADRNLGGGTARRLEQSISALSDAADALNTGGSDLFATIDNLDSFVTALNSNDRAVRSFTGELGGVSRLLADNRTELGTAVSTLDDALGVVTGFLKSNRGAIKGSVGALQTLTATLAKHAGDLEDILHITPTTFANFYNSLDPRYGVVAGRLTFANFGDSVASLVCGAIGGLVDLTTTSGQATFANQCAKGLDPLAKLLHLDNGIPGTPGGPPIVGATAAPATRTPAAHQPTSHQPTKAAPSLLGKLLELLLPGGN